MAHCLRGLRRRGSGQKKLKNFKPDLILLDIGLPKLNGIEAARQITKIPSNSKILFLSAFHSLEVVEQALNTGANGYIVKLDAGSELVVAVEAVFQGKRYVSSRLKGVISAQGRGCTCLGQTCPR